MAKLICPHCGVFTSPHLHTFKATVTTRGSTGEYRHRDGTAEAITPHIPGYPVYGIIVCEACGKYFVAEKKLQEWSAVYPIQHKTVATEIPPPIRGELEEANLCFAVGAYRACISMCMTALEALWRDKNASGLNDLKGKGIISAQLFDQATEIRLWAGMVKHKLIHETVQPEETEELLTYLEDILYDVYVQPAHTTALRQKREQVKKDNKSKTSTSGSQL